MKTLIFAGLLYLTATAAFAENPTYNADIVKTACSTEWVMVTYCANENIQAQRELETILPDLPPNIATEIKSRCTKEWGIEIPMIVYCANERATGWRSINN